MTRFVICLDGTWNNAAREVERADGSKVYRPTNVLKIARATKIATAQTSQVTYYDAGVGAMSRAPSGASKMVKVADNMLGGVLGAGFEVNIEQAYSFLAQNYRAGDELFVFGFSRGAAQARSLCRFVEWVGGVPAKRDAYYIPTLFTRYLEESGAGSGADFWAAQSSRQVQHNRAALDAITPVDIRFLGVWDTVLSLGTRFRPRGRPTPESLAFHTPAVPPATVSRVRHALAIDEARHDFQAEIFTSNLHPDLEQRWFAGVHSNVGGGLLDDSLANCALHWMVSEALDVGLALDEEFLRFFGAYPNGTMSQKSRSFKVIDTVLRPLRGFKGERNLVRESGMTVDDSVVTRLNADPSAHQALDESYRPKNLLRYLAQHPERRDQLNDAVKGAVAALA